jgi:hypothetical protein
MFHILLELGKQVEVVAPVVVIIIVVAVVVSVVGKREEGEVVAQHIIINRNIKV